MKLKIGDTVKPNFFKAKRKAKVLEVRGARVLIKYLDGNPREVGVDKLRKVN